MTLVACIGGGQLGRMLGLAGLPLGLSFRFLDPSPDACARGVGELVVGEYGDPDALDRLADGADVVTYEFENVPVEAAERVGAVPGRAALEHGQDRLREKELFRSLGIATARFGTLEETGLPALVKSRRLGYDGKGQRRVDAPDPPREGEIAEELVPFDRELSIVGVRGRDGETRFWPVAENLHREGILRVTRAPAPDAPQRGGGGDLRHADGRARLRRRPRRRALRGGRPPTRERVRAARAQHGALDDRRRRDEPVREPPARAPRPAARVDAASRAVARWST